MFGDILGDLSGVEDTLSQFGNVGNLGNIPDLGGVESVIPGMGGMPSLTGGAGGAASNETTTNNSSGFQGGSIQFGSNATISPFVMVAVVIALGVYFVKRKG
ncbi:MULTISPECIES: hypothetical protein [Aliivibrio]|uniref:Uncharacterized protein n=1 Tax=Aliivibrio finisterrensis TaxID=511998 RepID=A0A4Q5KYS2_9GAMM|nr:MULTISPECIES: hypothetical protein [Aliivibrio]MDD9178429.1 hypothetical protein [Aliivibrio sp. A6]RYU53324.1 hypothetical protein ERW57_04135 [Aliivibrio finisterrensis]RYU65831.1 hypothetical protein ERW53_04655 [Aliivibrio finisterrensis]RYU86622.1 hypothetical protein ERW52_05995 [Aliivibrio finisterrensis]